MRFLKGYWHFLYSEEDIEGGCVIIHEIYDSEDAHEQFEADLERALESQCSMIVIEPTKIGEETARWIQVGNCLHKTAVLSGLGCFVAPWILPRAFKEPISFVSGGVSILCTTLYGISWQFDPCCKYQVEYDTKKLAKLPLGSLTSSSPVVLVKRDDKYRKKLHNFVTGCVAIYCGWKIYTWYFTWKTLTTECWMIIKTVMTLCLGPLTVTQQYGIKGWETNYLRQVILQLCIHWEDHVVTQCGQDHMVLTNSFGTEV